MSYRFSTSPMASWPGCLSGVAKNSGQMTRKEHVAVFAAGEIRLVYAGWANNGRDVPLSDPIRVKASIEYPAGKYFPIHFDGQDADGYVTILPGTNATSLPCDLTLPSGAKFYSNSSVIAGAGQIYPVGRDHGAVAFTPPDFCTVDTTADYTLSPQPDPSDKWQYCYIPIAICGVPTGPARKLPIVGILGDSIAQGMGTPVLPWTGKEPGIVEEACQRAGIGYVNFGINGYPASLLPRYLAGNMALLEMLGACTDVVLSAGCDDLYYYKLGRGTAPFIIRNLQSIWAILAERRLKIWQLTIPPNTRSTDRYRTTAGQSPRVPNFGPEVSGGSQWSIVNAFIRGAPAPLSGVIDIAAGVGILDPRGYYVWKPGFTADGTHPLPTAGKPDVVSLVPVGSFG